MSVRVPDNEEVRVAVLESLHVLDTRPEPTYDELAHLAARLVGCPIAMINMVAAEHVWSKANVGFPDNSVRRAVSPCAQVVADGKVIAIPDLAADPRTSLLPMVVQGPRLRSYIGFPLTLAGRATVGTLAVMDIQPRQFDSEHTSALQTLAHQVIAHLELRRLRAEKADAVAAVSAAATSAEGDPIPAAIWTTDRELRITSARGSGLALLHMNPSDVLGRSLYEFFATQDVRFAPIAAHLAVLQGASPGPMRWTGWGHVMEVHIEPLFAPDSTSDIIGTSGIAIDVTQRAQMELDAQHQAQELVEVATGSVTIEH